MPKFPLPNLSVEEYERLSRKLLTEVPDEAVIAHAMRGRGGYMPSSETKIPQELLDLADLVRAGDLDGSEGLSPVLDGLYKNKGLSTPRYKEAMAPTLVNSDKPTYLSREEGLFSLFSDPSRKEDLLSMNVIDPKNLDPTLDYDENIIYRSDPGDEMFSTLNVADPDEALVTRSTLDKISAAGNSMPAAQYNSLVKKGAAPFAVGGVTAGAILSPEESQAAGLERIDRYGNAEEERQRQAAKLLEMRDAGLDPVSMLSIADIIGKSAGEEVMAKKADWSPEKRATLATIANVAPHAIEAGAGLIGGIASAAKRGMYDGLEGIKNGFGQSGATHLGSSPLGKTRKPTRGFDRLRKGIEPEVEYVRGPTEYVEVPGRGLDLPDEALDVLSQHKPVKAQPGAKEPRLDEIAAGYTPAPRETYVDGPKDMSFVPNSLSQLKGMDKELPLTSVITGKGAGELFRNNPDLLDKNIRALSPDAKTATAQRALYQDDILLDMENSTPGGLMSDLMSHVKGKTPEPKALDQAGYDAFMDKIAKGELLTPKQNKLLDDFEDQM